MFVSLVFYLFLFVWMLIKSFIYLMSLTFYIKGFCLSKQRTHKITKPRTLDLIESLYMQQGSLRGCIRTTSPAPAPTTHTPPTPSDGKRYLIFKITRMGSMIPKEIKYNLHYDDVRRDLLQQPHGTTYLPFSIIRRGNNGSWLDLEEA